VVLKHQYTSIPYFLFFGTPCSFSHIHYMNVNLLGLKDKGQGEVHTRTGHVGPEGEQRHNSTFSLTSALELGGRSPCSSCSKLAKRPSIHCARGWVDPGPVWTGAENLAPQLGFDPWIIQHTASHYTDYAILDDQLGGLTNYFHHTN
jgi:hypothetical protein